jgi:hypothetical protein
MRRTWVGATWRWCRLPSRKGRVALGGGGRSKPAIPRLIGSVFLLNIESFLTHTATNLGF